MRPTRLDHRLCAAAALLAALLCLPAAGAAASEPSPEVERLAPGQVALADEVVVRYAGEQAPETVPVEDGDLTSTLQTLRDDPDVRWADPNPIATASGSPIPNDPGRSNQKGGWTGVQWNFLPPPPEGEQCTAKAPCGVGAPRAWQLLKKSGHQWGRRKQRPARADRRRRRHRRRLPLARQALPPRPRPRRRRLRPRQELHRPGIAAARPQRPRHPRRLDDRRADRQRALGHRARAGRAGDAGPRARQRRRRLRRRRRQRHRLGGRPRRQGDQPEPRVLARLRQLPGPAGRLRRDRPRPPRRRLRRRRRRQRRPRPRADAVPGRLRGRRRHDPRLPLLVLEPRHRRRDHGSRRRHRRDGRRQPVRARTKTAPGSPS